MIFESIFIIYFILAIISVIFSRRLAPHEYRRSGQNVLILTAHPDDETMFFGPTIISKLQAHHKLYVLCLSSGDYYGIGAQRAKELEECGRVLDITRVDVVDDRRLPDNANEWWDPKIVTKYVTDFVAKHDIHSIITFDDYGISGHPNHRVLYRTLLDLKKSSLEDIDTYCLESVSICRKYLSFLEVPLNLVMSRLVHKTNRELHVISFNDYLWLLRALRQHKSQMVWFRHLYYTFSRYMFANQLIPI